MGLLESQEASASGADWNHITDTSLDLSIRRERIIPMAVHLPDPGVPAMDKKFRAMVLDDISPSLQLLLL